MPPRKILAVKLRALGDTVLMTAPLTELRKTFPGAEIHVVVHTPWASILEGHPAVDRIWPYERHEDRGARAKAIAGLGFRLRKEHFDWAVNFHASPSSSMLSFGTGAKVRAIHFHGHRQKNRYSTVSVPGKGTLKPTIERDMDTIRALGIHVPAGRLPQLYLSASEQSAAKERFSKLRLLQPVLGLGLGASRPAKNWPMDRFASLAVEWSRQKEGGVLAIAGPDEANRIHEFLQAVDDALAHSVPNTAERVMIRSRIVTEGQLSLRQTMAVLSLLSVFAGNDSGPRHLAVAVNTPTVTIFGPEHPFEWHPYPPERHPFLFLDNLACRQDADPGMPPWCATEPCIIEQQKCMRSIGVNAVLAECLRIAR
ncbi:glycosyltransferase family 9 protein [Bdellovibrionota bacterium FG-1]